MSCWRGLGLERVGGGDGLVGVCRHERRWPVRRAGGERSGAPGDSVEGG